MIQLHPNYLLFENSSGQIIPCSAELIAVELIGDGSGSIDSELLKQAAAAVLHYFRQDLGRTTVSVADFSCVLVQTLKSMGVRLDAEDEPKPRSSCDLRRLVAGSKGGFELEFFSELKKAFLSALDGSPEIMRFHGLRDCAKQLAGAKRWNQRCQVLSDQIVSYLRACLASESVRKPSGLVIF